MPIEWYSINIENNDETPVLNGFFSIDTDVHLSNDNDNNTFLVTGFYDSLNPETNILIYNDSYFGTYSDYFISIYDGVIGIITPLVLKNTPSIVNYNGSPILDYSIEIYDSAINIYEKSYLTYSNPLFGLYSYLTTNTYQKIPDPSCFNHNTKILCLNKNFEEEYLPIQDLKKGDLVKTYLHGYRKIDCIMKETFISNPIVWWSSMFIMKKTEENKLFDDLIVTGSHCILVDELSAEEQEKQNDINFNIKIDDKHLLLASVSDNFTKIEESTEYTYYHFVPENNGDNNERFGVWANGILSETPSINQFMETLKN